MRSLFFVSLICLSLVAAAQKQRPSQNDRALPPLKFGVTFSPLALLQIDYTLLSGFEYSLNKRLRLVADLGYIFSSVYYSAESNGAHGFIIRPGVKWMTSDKDGFYLQPQVFYKQVSHSLSGWVNKEVVNGTPSYQAWENFSYRRQVYGFNAIAGNLFSLDKEKNLFLDVYLGIGLRWKKVGAVDVDLTPGFRQPSPVFSTGTGTENQSYPSLPIGLRLLYRIK